MSMFCLIRIDATKEDNSFGRLMNDNHKTPNAKPKVVTYMDKPYICFFAKKTINPDEEVTYSYGPTCPQYWWRYKVSVQNI